MVLGALEHLGRVGVRQVAVEAAEYAVRVAVRTVAHTSGVDSAAASIEAAALAHLGRAEGIDAVISAARGTVRNGRNCDRCGDRDCALLSLRVLNEGQFEGHFSFRNEQLVAHWIHLPDRNTARKSSRLSLGPRRSKWLQTNQKTGRPEA